MEAATYSHIFDRYYPNIHQKKYFFLFGAGHFGQQFYAEMYREIMIVGYIDNNVNKAGTQINGLPCMSFRDVRLSSDVGIIITMASEIQASVAEQLHKTGWIKNKDFFLMDEFMFVVSLQNWDRCKTYLSQSRQAWRNQAKAIIGKSRQAAYEDIRHD